jgi:pyridinium-3,5-biscarboxylic acid mononucleotide synthase
MDPRHLRDLLEGLENGKIKAEEAYQRLKTLPFEDLGFARIDHHRALRTGYPETIFCQGKTPAQILAIAQHLLADGSPALGTRLAPEAAALLRQHYPQAEYDELARTALIFPEEYSPPPQRGYITLVSAGTADLPVAREALVTARSMGARVETVFDAGVAGIHRLLASAETLRQAHVVVVVAGMEGALASVVGGLVDAPVIAVPTSIGYGASFGGLAPLLTMLNSCATGVTVVNIDNGFGAGYAAAQINNRICDAQNNSTQNDEAQHDTATDR